MFCVLSILALTVLAASPTKTDVSSSAADVSFSSTLVVGASYFSTLLGSVKTEK